MKRGIHDKVEGKKKARHDGRCKIMITQTAEKAEKNKENERVKR